MTAELLLRFISFVPRIVEHRETGSHIDCLTDGFTVCRRRAVERLRGRAFQWCQKSIRLGAPVNGGAGLVTCGRGIIGDAIQ